MSHPFDRYDRYTDVQALHAYSAKPLRKCIRANTLKMSIEELLAYAKDMDWQLTPVPWTPEGFYIDRDDRSVPLGKDLLHELGYTYIQEAASMLPVALLDPKPGEFVLDMAAAPGSKTTQIGALMQGRGVVIANDMQPKRLKTLKEAVHRLGVRNVAILKKLGQQYEKLMTGRFDRVLIDAPCTAQGTARKDADALTYCSVDNIGKMAKLQRELLESAVHAARINGRIVYSTCTLTPEENEQVVLDILGKFPQLKIVDPREMKHLQGWDMSKAIEDSFVVQKDVGGNGDVPMLRLWPQTYDTEGFFCAVLQKTGATRDLEPIDLMRLDEFALPGNRQREIEKYLVEQMGHELLREDDCLLDMDDHLHIVSRELLQFKLPTKPLSAGVPFGKRLRDIPVLLDHDAATLRGNAGQGITLTSEQLQDLLAGNNIESTHPIDGQVLLQYQGRTVGLGKARNGSVKNSLPRWLVLMHS